MEKIDGPLLIMKKYFPHNIRKDLEGHRNSKEGNLMRIQTLQSTGERILQTNAQDADNMVITEKVVPTLKFPLPVFRNEKDQG